MDSADWRQMSCSSSSATLLSGDLRDENIENIAPYPPDSYIQLLILYSIIFTFIRITARLIPTNVTNIKAPFTFYDPLLMVIVR